MPNMLFNMFANTGLGKCLINRHGICEARFARIMAQICVFRKENTNLQPDSRQPSFTNAKPGYKA